jgi:hypothetical protein
MDDRVLQSVPGRPRGRIPLGALGIVMAPGVERVEFRLVRRRPEYRGRA